MHPSSIVFRSEVLAIRFFERDQRQSALWALLPLGRIRSVPHVKELPQGFVHDVKWDQWRESAGSRMFGKVKGALVGPGKRLIKYGQLQDPVARSGSLTNVQEDLCGKCPEFYSLIFNYIHPL